MSENSTKKSKWRPRRKEWWAEQIEACAKSGMNMVAYARANGLNLSSLYNWKTVLRREQSKKEIRRAEEVKPIRFFEVTVDAPKIDAIVEIASPGGWKVRVPWQVDAETVSRFIAVIEGRS